MLTQLLCLVVGVIVGGFIVRNNMTKALAIMEAAKKAAEAELGKLKK